MRYLSRVFSILSKIMSTPAPIEVQRHSDLINTYTLVLIIFCWVSPHRWCTNVFIILGVGVVSKCVAALLVAAEYMRRKS